MAATAAPATLPPYSQVKIVGSRTIEFSDGFYYNFENAQLLSQAQNVDQMGHLQQIGERVMWRLTLNAWIRGGDSLYQWERMYEGAMGWKTYLAWIADAAGLRNNIMKKGGVSLSVQQHQTMEEQGNFVEKAGGVEALVGAVFEDCGRDHDVTSEVMRRLGIYWPESAGDSAQLKAFLQQLRTIGIIRG
ncbi:hypothetical protein M409DRAFT_53133 [Zasmidium cellare ATCC 36951]|uniref:RNase III domain-containing protein n=1 Tax=Zasmidium cellare ATCC 36951 TaxID=1080233 RepID=A0A6A6CRQ1_ZASCE|nr:uncharacterized protein M409DRAFT_53133 [Zasmidium cellare ATCC 36951]KAF2168459.1 hypothetical protein M409DRAFT_53133 [Zasmidium cellare ATCC 36951]